MRPKTPRLGVDEPVIDRFAREILRAGRSEATAARHRSNLRRFLAWCRPQLLDAEALAVADVAAYLEHERVRGLSPIAIASVLGTLRVFYDQRCPDGPNPARDIPTPRFESRVLAPYQPAEATAILDDLRAAKSIGARFDRAVVVMLAATGIRRVELVRLRADDLDLDAGVLLVRDGPTGDRSVPLPGETLEVLVGYVADVRPACPSSDRLFANPRASFDSPGHGRLETSVVGHLVRRVGRRSGVDGPHTCHRWRVTATVDLLRAGVATEEVGRRLGHGQPATTARYLRLLDGETPTEG